MQVTIEFEDVLNHLEADRASGLLAAQVIVPGEIRYQASATHPGLLDQIDSEGVVTVGQFIDGAFVPHNA